MLKELLGAVEFAVFLGALGALCVWVSQMPWYRKLSQFLFPDNGNGNN